MKPISSIEKEVNQIRLRIYEKTKGMTPHSSLQSIIVKAEKSPQKNMALKLSQAQKKTVR
jgi:hypothetical protein